MHCTLSGKRYSMFKIKWYVDNKVGVISEAGKASW